MQKPSRLGCSWLCQWAVDTPNSCHLEAAENARQVLQSASVEEAMQQKKEVGGFHQEKKWKIIVKTHGIFFDQMKHLHQQQLG